MSVIDLEFYSGDDPNGALLGTLTDAECSAISLRVALRGLGAGSFSIPLSHPSATSSLIAKGNYVKVVIPSIQAEPVWGFWLWEGKFDLLDENGDDTLTFSGPGPLGILRDAILHEDCFAPAPPASPIRGSFEREGYWYWITEPYGAIVTRIIEEGQNQTGTPLAPVTIDFDRALDSDGLAWPDIEFEYQQPIQSNTLKVFEDLRDAGDLFVFSDPDFLVQTFQTFGTDRTSLTFAAGKVRLTDTNILTGLPVHIHATNELTHVLGRDLDGAYFDEVQPGFAGRARWGAIDVPETNDAVTLAKVGQETLRVSTQNTNAFELEVTPGDDEATGRYLPWLHYNVGDIVTVDAATGLFAYVDEDAQIVAFRVELDEAADDSTTDSAHRSLHTVLEFNAATAEGVPIEGRTVSGGPGCRCLTLCRDSSVTWEQSIAGDPLTSSFTDSVLTVSAPSGNTGSIRRWADVYPGGATLPNAMLWRVLMHWDSDVDGWDLILSMDGQPDPQGSSEWVVLGFNVNSDDFTASLATSEGGADSTVIASTPGDGNEFEYYVRVRLESGAVRARIWEVTDPEPGTWTLEDAVTDESPLAGALLSMGVQLLGVSNDGTDAANFEVENIEPGATGACIHGGPLATAGDPTESCNKCAATGGHQHDYVAAGGATGEVLAKASAADYHTEWVTPGGVTDILDLPTAETDDTLVLAPDGAGGVEFRAETGGGGGGSGATVVGSADDIGASPLSVAAPGAIAAGDLIIFAVNTVNSIPAAGGPSGTGWTELVRFDTSTNEFNAAYWKISDGTETSFDITHSAGSEACAAAVVYRGADTAWTSGYAIDSYVSPGVLGHPSGLLVVVWFAAGAGGSNLVVPGQITQDEFIESATANKSQILIAHRDSFAEAGAGQFVATSSAALTFAGALAAVFHP